MRFRRESAREALSDVYYGARVAFERGYLDGSREHRRVSVSLMAPESPHWQGAYKAGREAAKTGGSSAMPDDAFLKVFVEWCR